MITLHELSIENYIRVVDATIKFMQKCEAHFLDNGQDLNEILSTQLAPDMLPFTFQLCSVQHHSLNAAKGILAGEFGPPNGVPELDYAGWINLLQETKAELEAISADDINGCAGKPVIFKFGSREIPFTAENFVQSFSLPNLHFHSSTAYDILRLKGAPIGKMDYLGHLKIGI